MNESAFSNPSRASRSHWRYASLVLVLLTLVAFCAYGTVWWHLVNTSLDPSKVRMFPASAFALALGSIVTAMVLTLGLTIYIIVDVVKSEHSSNGKILWIFLLFFFGLLAIVPYGVLYLWRPHPEQRPNYALIIILSILVVILGIGGSIFAGVKAFGRVQAEAQRAIHAGQAAQQNEVKFGDTINQAKTAYDVGNYPAIITIADSALGLANNDVDRANAYYWRGLGYNHTNEPALATADEDKSVQLDPTFGPPHVVLGAIAYNQRNYQAALTEANEAIKLDPNYSYGYNLRGTVEAGQGNKAAASSDFQHAIALDPNITLFQQNLAALK